MYLFPSQVNSFSPAFLAEELHQNLVRSVDADAPESVHMSFYPKSEQSYVDEDLSMATRLVMRLASLGRSARSRVGIRVRQPLGDILVKCRSAEEERLLGSVSDQLLDELNIKRVSQLVDEGEVLEYSVRPNLELLGPNPAGVVSTARATFFLATVAISGLLSTFYETMNLTLIIISAIKKGTTAKLSP